MLRDPGLTADSGEGAAAGDALVAAPPPPGEGRGTTHRTRLKWIALGLVGAFLALLLLLALTAPLSKSLQAITTPSITLLSAEGVPIARRGAVVEAPVDAATLPEHVVQPFLAIEDRRFYSHVGIDPKGLARALLANVRERDVVEGGSTITQQLAKLSFLSPEQTLWRKLQEVVLALWLEAQLSKDDILSRYLSSVYFGDNVFGLRAAARHYFSRDPDELSVEQAAMLAGLLKAPSTLAPTKNLKGARDRAGLVVAAMVSAGMMTQAEADDLPRVQLKTGGLRAVPTGSYFADWVMPQVEVTLDSKYPAHRVATTLEDRLQREAANAIRRVGTGGAQVALVAMRRDGRVVAMVGGKSYERSPFNRATQALRQPGSTFKLFVYLAALREGYTPLSRIQDRPLRIGKWAPENYGGQYRGDITLRQAFAFSSNVAAVRLAEAVGRDKVAAAARDLGLTRELEPGPTMTLGTSGVPLIELVGAYAAVSAGRYPLRPHGLQTEAGERPAATMDKRVRDGLLELLWAAANEGSGRGARLSAPTFGKTGTSQEGRDAYFIGFSGDLVTGVWIGHDDNRPMPGAQGGGTPAAIWKAFMTRALAPSDRAAAQEVPVREAPTARPASPQGAPVVRAYDVDDGTPGEDPGGLEPFEGAGESAEAPLVEPPLPGADLRIPPLIEIPSAPAPAAEPTARPAPRITAPPASVPAPKGTPPPGAPAGAS